MRSACLLPVRPGASESARNPVGTTAVHPIDRDPGTLEIVGPTAPIHRRPDTDSAARTTVRPRGILESHSFPTLAMTRFS